MADDFLYGMSRQLNRNFEKTLDNWKAHAEKLERRVDELEQEGTNLEYGLDRRDAHLVAAEAQIDYLMGLLDKAYGEEDNPARQAAYSNPDEMRIPSGPREGQVVTMRDHIYLTAFAEAFKTKFARKWSNATQSWKKFLHPRISF